MKTTKIKQLSLIICSVLLLLSSPIQANKNQKQNTSDMPKGLWQAFSDVRHKIEPVKQKQVEKKEQIYKAFNPGNHLSMQFSSAGLILAATGKGANWHLNMQLNGYGQAQQLNPVRAAQIKTEGRKITYQRGEISEWYINGNKGLEQGFTLNKPPENYQKEKPIVISLALQGNVKPKWETKGQALTFYSKDQQQAFTYNKLKAFDAKGKELPAEMVLAEQQILLQVNIDDASWPITIDPLLSVIETKVLAANNDAEDHALFGIMAALDGNTALISAIGDCDSLNITYSHIVYCGAAYVFIKSGNDWSLQQKLVAEDRNVGDSFGISVALEANTVLIGAYFDSDDCGSTITHCGAVYVFNRSGNLWTQKQKLVAEDPKSDSLFGVSLALNGDTALIGASSAGNCGEIVLGCGAAYVFTLLDNSWSQQQKLTSENTEEKDYFGQDVVLEGDTILVGASLNDSACSKTNHRCGAVYAYTRFGNTWSLQQKIIAEDPNGWQRFGLGLSLSANTLLISAVDLVGNSCNDEVLLCGVVFVYTYTGGQWIIQQKLVAEASDNVDSFGFNHTLNGDTAMIGKSFNAILTCEDINFDCGITYVFTRTDNTWTLQQKLVVENSDGFGRSLALDGNTALIGAGYDDEACSGSDINCGAAFVYTRLADGTWSQHQKLTAETSDPGNVFGVSTAIDGDTAVIGATGDDSSTGSAYVFSYKGGYNWQVTNKLIASDRAASDGFGKSVAINGSTVLVGAFRDDDHVVDSGSAYIFEQPSSGWGVFGTELTETAKLTASDAGNTAHFGRSVSLSENAALIGAYLDDAPEVNSGSAYIFEKPPSGWVTTGTETAKLTSSVRNIEDHFGFSVSLQNDTALIGANLANGVRGDQGLAYIYQKPPLGWHDTDTETVKLMASDASTSDYFGTFVSLSEDGKTALIGADLDNNSSEVSNTGSAYLFEKPAIGGWGGRGSELTEVAKLTASDSVAEDRFGFAGAISGKNVMIAAHQNNAGGLKAGQAYLFVKPAEGWRDSQENKKLPASDAAAGDQYGYSIAYSGDTAVIGAPFDNEGGDDTGSAYFKRFECGTSGSVPADRWTMLAIPCQLDLASTITDVLGDDFLIRDYLTTWAVYGWEASLDNFVLMDPTSTLQQGQGYWIWSQNGGFWDAGEGTATTYQANAACPSAKGCYEIDLVAPDSADKTRYNLIGLPGNQATQWSSVRFIVNGIAYTPYTAELNGYVSKTLLKYNGNSYEAYDDTTPGMEGTLNTYDGFWIKTLGGSTGATIKMLVPNGDAIGAPPGPQQDGLSQNTNTQSTTGKPWLARLLDFIIPPAQAEKPNWQQEWYLRLIAISENENLKDKNNVIGQLQDSNDAYDSHDLPELAPFSRPFLTLSFPQPDWGDKADDYNSDYHAVKTDEADTWHFEIKTDDPNRDITLYWDGVYLLESIKTQNNRKKTWSQHKQVDASKLYSLMKLEDLDLGITTPATQDGTINHYSFNMEGKAVRTFRWVYNGKKGKPAAKIKRPKPSKARQNTYAPDYNPLEHMAQPGKRIGNITP